MPSSTFFNLPEEKREKLLRSARAEFARVPYDQASINRIIRAAGIPRGSFYMYFEDKADLFYYLLSEYGRRLSGLMERSLSDRDGDLFAAFLDFFDAVVAGCHAPEGPGYDVLGRIMLLNRDLRPDAFLRKDAPVLMEHIIRAIDQDRLDLRRPSDLHDILRVLVAAMGHAVREGVLSDDPAPVRARYANTLDILARGMAKAPAPATSHT